MTELLREEGLVLEPLVAGGRAGRVAASVVTVLEIRRTERGPVGPGTDLRRGIAENGRRDPYRTDPAPGRPGRQSAEGVGTSPTTRAPTSVMPLRIANGRGRPGESPSAGSPIRPTTAPAG